LILVLVPLSGCEDPFFKPSVRPIERSLGAAIPIAYVATLATAAFDGQATTCTDFSTDCADPPCGGVVNILVDDNCPFPIADGATGVVSVVGARMSEEVGLFSAVFTEVDIPGDKLMLRSIDAFIVSKFSPDLIIGEPRTETGIKVIYYDIDVEFEDSQALDLAHSEWIIDVATMDTPGDPSDDVMSIFGARQAVETGSGFAAASQTALVMTKYESSCRRNPVSGFGIIESADTSRLADNGITMLGFRPECDGKALVLLAVGMATPSTGTEVTLNLFD
jgi:hypothetical protein